MLPPSVVLFILTMLWVTVRAEQPLGAYTYDGLA